jgi:uncharacterized SAM-binding protein YcdF (DUF218 family)
LLALGVPPARIAGDSCAFTTWETATFTDPWQLARASAAFRRQNLQVIPLAVTPALTPAQRNRLALRETAATLLYRLQGRF